VDALRQPRRVCRILSAGNDAFVRLTLAMEVFEINVVVGKDGALVSDRVGEYFRVVNAQAASTRFLDCQDVVPKTAEFLDNR